MHHGNALRLYLGLVALAFVGALPSFGLEFDLRLKAAVTEPIPVVLSIEEAGGRARRMTATMTAPGQGVIEVPSGDWFISAEGSGLWARTRTLTQPGTAAPFVLEFEPAGFVSGRLQTSGGPLPSTIEIRRERVPTVPFDSDAKLDPEVRRICPVSNDGLFRCQLPAGQVDLSVRAKGSAARFFWNRRLPPGGELALGTIPIEPGGSVIGWLVAGQGRRLSGAIEVSLDPVRGGPAPPEAGRERLRTVATRPQPSGFFQLEQIPSGTYRVTAREIGQPDTVGPAVTVFGAAEMRLRDPLTLFTASRLELFVEPPTDPEGAPWSISLSRGTGSPGRLERVGEPSTAALDGSWRSADLPTGTYWVEIRDRHGASFAAEPVSVTPESGPFFLTLEFVPVRGRLHLGSEAVAGEVRFRSRKSAVTFTTDEDGRFEGVLPRPGRWLLDIRSASGAVSRKGIERWITKPRAGQVVEIDLALPATRLRGVVVDENHQLQPASLVFRRFGGADEPQPTHTDSGTFEFSGLDPGTYELVAEANGQASEPALVDLGEKRSGPPVRLVLRAQRQLSGTVLGPFGPVAGARILAQAILPGGQVDLASPIAEAVSDLEGRFALRLPPSSTAFAAAIEAPGYGRRQLRVSSWPEGELQLVVDPEGGTIRLALDHPFDPERPGSTQPVVIGPAGLPLSPPGQGDPLVTVLPWTERTYPLLAPGTYTACWFPTSQQAIATQASGSPASSPFCRSGTLQSNQELELSVAHPEPQPK